jgi:hypothetical protein
MSRVVNETSGECMPSWENLPVTITETWGEGGKINFDDAPIQPPRFRLLGVYLPVPGGAPVLAHYAVEFNAGYMVEWWSGVAMFPMGNDTPSIDRKLPPFDGSAAHRGLYREAFAPLRAKLLKADTNLARLEGYMTVLYMGKPRVDRVQMTYQSGAIIQPDGRATDLVFVLFSPADSGGVAAPLENGGGTGPPH